MPDKPILAISIGDPAGIGPEVTVKALADGALAARPLLIGDTASVERAVALTGARLGVHRVAAAAEARYLPGTLDVLDPGTLAPRDITVGRASGACGRAVLEWIDIADRLARAGAADAVIMGSVNSESIKLSGSRGRATRFPPGSTYLFLISGPLRIVHLTDHIPLRQVCLEGVRKDNILTLLRLAHASLERWGVAKPRIGVAGLNPHAQGEEEAEEIAPAIAAAVAEGIAASGPVSPDTVFRQGIEGRYDCVMALYHDQGHIPLKTWGFSGNFAFQMGAPYLHGTVAHGTAFDIAGKGIADHSMMRAALTAAASLAAGHGFPG